MQYNCWNFVNYFYYNDKTVLLKNLIKVRNMQLVSFKYIQLFLFTIYSVDLRKIIFLCFREGSQVNKLLIHFNFHISDIFH